MVKITNNLQSVFVIFLLDEILLLNKILIFYSYAIGYITRQKQPPGVLLGF